MVIFGFPALDNLSKISYIKIMKHLTVLALMLPVCVNAQINSGARISAIGGAGVAIQDIWSVQKNPAGLSGFSKPMIAFNFEQRLLSEDVSTQSAMIFLPLKRNILALGFQRYGFSAYNHQKYALAYARIWGPLSAGINFNYNQIRIVGYGTSHAIAADAGFQYRAAKYLVFGAHISNPSNSQFSENTSANLPMALAIGAACSFSDKVILSTEIEKILEYNTNVKAGIEYTLLNWVAFRGGISSNPFRQYGGIGIYFQRLRFDTTVSSDITTGFSPQAGLSYEF